MQDTRSQSDKFKGAAREHESVGDETRWVAKAKITSLMMSTSARRLRRLQGSWSEDSEAASCVRLTWLSAARSSSFSFGASPRCGLRLPSSRLPLEFTRYFDEDAAAEIQTTRAFWAHSRRAKLAPASLTRHLASSIAIGIPSL